MEQSVESESSKDLVRENALGCKVSENSEDLRHMVRILEERAGVWRNPKNPNHPRMEGAKT